MPMTKLLGGSIRKNPQGGKLDGDSYCETPLGIHMVSATECTANDCIWSAFPPPGAYLAPGGLGYFPEVCPGGLDATNRYGQYSF